MLAGHEDEPMTLLELRTVYKTYPGEPPVESVRGTISVHFHRLPLNKAALRQAASSVDTPICASLARMSFGVRPENEKRNRATFLTSGALTPR